MPRAPPRPARHRGRAMSDQTTVRVDLRQRVAAFPAEHDPAGTDRLEFLRARYDAGLAWVFFPPGHGGVGLPRALQPEVEALFATAGAPGNKPRAHRLRRGTGPPASPPPRARGQ